MVSVISVDVGPAGRAGGRKQAGGELQWYSRQELAGRWLVALCSEHGRALKGHRFHRVPAPDDRQASGCAACLDTHLLRAVENCTCETDTGRCPEHSNLGCSC